MAVPPVGCEPPTPVSIDRELVFAAGLQPEDYGVLIRLVMRDEATDLRTFAAELRQTGWKISPDRLTGIVRRLEAAGYATYGAQYNPATGRPVWTLEGSLTPLAPPRAPHKSRSAASPGWAYAVRDTATGRIKIGSSRAPLKRLAALRTGAASPVDFVWLAEGGAALEIFLHEEFAAQRVQGEWFDFGRADATKAIQEASSRFGGER
ncbi:GIY-YIG nuclease family protein [Streptomyces sp. NPDC052127]|uniref:GIY-YIG nuclease family protein n=1 Tax=Streptomyces sp. NPDC052127 TaxID=3155679 RepID=UPI0034417233